MLQLNGSGNEWQYLYGLFHFSRKRHSFGVSDRKPGGCSQRGSGTTSEPAKEGPFTCSLSVGIYDKQRLLHGAAATAGDSFRGQIDSRRGASSHPTAAAAPTSIIPAPRNPHRAQKVTDISP